VDECEVYESLSTLTESVIYERFDKYGGCLQQTNSSCFTFDYRGIILFP
jgi:hypothetical protein